MDEMARAHASDYADKRRIDLLRSVLEDFLTDPPRRVAVVDLDRLRLVKSRLDHASAHIVRVWD